MKNNSLMKLMDPMNYFWPVFKDELFDAPVQWSFQKVQEYKDYFTKEEADKKILEYAVPGLREEDISVEVRGNQMIIKADPGEKPISNLSTKLETSYYDTENIYDLEKAEISYNYGILKLVIPKNEAKKTKKLKVLSS